MTNKEHLSTLTDEQWWNRVEWLFQDYSKQFTDSRDAIINWLGNEYKSVKPIPYDPYDDGQYIYDCPVCHTLNRICDNKCRKCSIDFNFFG